MFIGIHGQPYIISYKSEKTGSNLAAKKAPYQKKRHLEKNTYIHTYISRGSYTLGVKEPEKLKKDIQLRSFAEIWKNFG